MSYENGGESQPMLGEFYPEFGVISDDPATIRRSGVFEITGLEEQLRTRHNSFLLSQDFIHEQGMDNYLMRSSRFEFRPDWAEGRKDSAHGVYFGELHLEIDDGSEKTIPIAAKPFTVLEADTAVHEYGALKFFNGSRSIHTFEPLGFWVNQYGQIDLLTRFEPTVVSLDNAQWDKTEIEPLKDHFDLFAALSVSAQILARLHSNGFSHRDAQIKNMAVDIETSEVRAIDLTTLRQVHTSERPAVDNWRRGVYNDLTALIGSIMRRGYLKGTSEKNIARVIDDSLISRHASVLRHPSCPVSIDRFVINSALEDIRSDVLEQL